MTDEQQAPEPEAPVAESQASETPAPAGNSPVKMAATAGLLAIIAVAGFFVVGKMMASGKMEGVAKEARQQVRDLGIDTVFFRPEPESGRIVAWGALYGDEERGQFDEIVSQHGSYFIKIDTEGIMMNEGDRPPPSTSPF